MPLSKPDRGAVLRLSHVDILQKEPAEDGNQTDQEIIDAAIAVYAWLDNNANFGTPLAGVIDTATSPTVIATAVKKRLVARVLEHYSRDELI